MTSWRLFPPQTREVQVDEKWAFVGKKQRHCDPENPRDAKRGDHWDHVAFDAEHRLVLSVVPGKRTEANTRKLLQDVRARLGGRTPDLLTSDNYRPYRAAILEAWGETVHPPRTGRRGRPRSPCTVPRPDLHYAIVHKTRKNGRVVRAYASLNGLWPRRRVEPRVIFGNPAEVLALLARSPVSRKVNTAFVERNNGTDRNRNARKVRRTYCFSKDWDIHELFTYFTYYSYNFCWPVRTLRYPYETGHWHNRTPAMSAALADHVWSLAERISFPSVQQS